MAAFATLSHGSNFPTLEETLAPDGAINPAILPERGWNAELGFRRLPGEGPFYYELSVFHLWIRDLLVARRTAEDQYIGVNAGRTLHRGLEGMIGWEKKWLPRAHELSAYASFTLADYRFAEFIDDGSDYSGNALPGAPGLLLQTGVDGRYGLSGGSALFAHLTVQVAGRQYADDANEVPVAGYWVVNSKVGWEKQFGKSWQIELFAGCNNLLDARYASMLAINAQGFGGALPRYYYPGLPRNGYVGFVLRQL
jgi:iron complex outermembrane receptor protein